jgi:hypothetical protein
MRTCPAWYGTKDTRLTSPVQAVSPTPAVSRAQEPERGTSGGCCASAPLLCSAPLRCPGLEKRFLTPFLIGRGRHTSLRDLGLL